MGKKIILNTIATLSVVMFAGCSSANMQDTGKAIGRMDCSNSPEGCQQDDNDNGIFGLIGNAVEIGGTIAETKDIITGHPAKAGKDYKYNSATSEADSIIVEDKNYSYYKQIYSKYTRKTWHDRNLGSLGVCKSTSDTTCYGDYFQWGRKADGHEKWDSYTTKSYSNLDSNYGMESFVIVSGDSIYKTLSRDYKYNWYGKDAKNNPCPSGFRLPDPLELEDELRRDKNNSFLKIGYNGYRNNKDGKIENEKNEATFWTAWLGYYIKVSNGNIELIESQDFTIGRSVRCIKD